MRFLINQGTETERRDQLHAKTLSYSNSQSLDKISAKLKKGKAVIIERVKLCDLVLKMWAHGSMWLQHESFQRFCNDDKRVNLWKIKNIQKFQKRKGFNIVFKQ